MQNKWIWGNIVLSIFIFCTIFYLNVGVSGGDIAIVIFAFLVAILQLMVNVILLYKKQTVSTLKIVSAILLTNVFLIVLFSEYGQSVNSWIKISFQK
jgi:hypothetical protein